MTIINGPDGTAADVNEEHELVVRSVVEAEMEHASALGRAYSWYSGSRDIDATDTMLFIKNTSDTPLILDRLNIIGGNVASAWTIHLGSATTTPTGTEVVGTNLNPRFASTPAEAVAAYDEGAVADGAIVDALYTAATVQAEPYDLTGIILEKGSYIQINQETESTAGSVTIFGHYANPA